MVKLLLMVAAMFVALLFLAAFTVAEKRASTACSMTPPGHVGGPGSARWRWLPPGFVCDRS
jgi:hypothetical protein